MTRGASHPLEMMPPGAQLTGVTGFALLWLSVRRSAVLCS